MKRIPIILFLLTASSIALAADGGGLNQFTPPPGDTSVDFLHEIFGNIVNMVSSGTDPRGSSASDVLGQMMSVFNTGVLFLAMVFVGYTTVTGTINSAHDGEVLGRKMSEIWVPTHHDFSFSPQELLRIIKPEPNKAHEIDADVAKTIWAKQQGTFELRIKIADRIAEIAANNEHWFQTGDFNCNPDVISRRASDYVAQKGAYGVLALLKGPKKTKPVKPISAWRQESHRSPKPLPTQNEIEHAGQVGNPRFWNMVNEEWRCPGCQRNKREVVRRNKDGEWVFPVATRIFFDSASPRNRRDILNCGDCAKTAEDMGKEAVSIAGCRPQGGYAAQVNIQEVQRCVIPRPHVRHNINNDEADLILENIVYRILQAREETGQ